VTMEGVTIQVTEPGSATPDAAGSDDDDSADDGSDEDLENALKLFGAFAGGSGSGHGSAADPMAAVGAILGSLQGIGSALGDQPAPAPNWVSMHSLPTPHEVTNVDVPGQLQVVLEDLRHAAADAALAQLVVMGVMPDGTVDLTGDGFDNAVGIIKVIVASPSKAGCAAASISRYQSMVIPYPTGCPATLRLPRCTVAQVRTRATAAGAPTTGGAILTYNQRDAGPGWQVIAGSFIKEFDDTCAAEGT